MDLLTEEADDVGRKIEYDGERKSSVRVKRESDENVPDLWEMLDWFFGNRINSLLLL